MKIFEPAMRHLIDTYTKYGQVRVSAPPHITDDNVRLAIISKLSWIKKQRAALQSQPRQSKRGMVSGENHYRLELKQKVPSLLAKWEPIIGQTVSEWGVKKMKTTWGSCNIEARGIWLNLEFAPKPPQRLEYILVHEMVHLLDRHHNDIFRSHMDRLLPNWRHHRDLLNAAPLAHEKWTY